MVNQDLDDNWEYPLWPNDLGNLQMMMNQYVYIYI